MHPTTRDFLIAGLLDWLAISWMPHGYFGFQTGALGRKVMAIYRDSGGLNHDFIPRFTHDSPDNDPFRGVWFGANHQITEARGC
jgi:hypothetical protein